MLSAIADGLCVLWLHTRSLLAWRWQFPQSQHAPFPGWPASLAALGSEQVFCTGLVGLEIRQPFNAGALTHRTGAEPLVCSPPSSCPPIPHTPLTPFGTLGGSRRALRGHAGLPCPRRLFAALGPSAPSRPPACSPYGLPAVSRPGFRQHVPHRLRVARSHGHLAPSTATAPPPLQAVQYGRRGCTRPARR